MRVPAPSGESSHVNQASPGRRISACRRSSRPGRRLRPARSRRGLRHRGSPDSAVRGAVRGPRPAGREPHGSARDAGWRTSPCRRRADTARTLRGSAELVAAHVREHRATRPGRVGDGRREIDKSASTNEVGTSPLRVAARLRPMASARPRGSLEKVSAARRSVTTTSLTRLSTSSRASRTGTGVTRPTQCDESPGVRTGTAMSRRLGSPATWA